MHDYSISLEELDKEFNQVEDEDLEDDDTEEGAELDADDDIDVPEELEDEYED